MTHPPRGRLPPGIPIKALPQKGALLWAPPSSSCPHEKAVGDPVCPDQRLGLAELWAAGSTLSQDRGNEPGQSPGRAALCPPQAGPPLLPRASLRRGSMGWEEAELQKCTLSTHRAHLLGNNPPFIVHRSRALCWDTPGGGGRLPQGSLPQCARPVCHHHLLWGN